MRKKAFLGRKCGSKASTTFYSVLIRLTEWEEGRFYAWLQTPPFIPFKPTGWSRQTRGARNESLSARPIERADAKLGVNSGLGYERYSLKLEALNWCRLYSYNKQSNVWLLCTCKNSGIQLEGRALFSILSGRLADVGTTLLYKLLTSLRGHQPSRGMESHGTVADAQLGIGRVVVDPVIFHVWQEVSSGQD